MGIIILLITFIFLTALIFFIFSLYTCNKEFQEGMNSNYYKIEKIIYKNKTNQIDLKNPYLKDSLNSIDEIELSIIIPVYNEEKRLQKTLNKIIKFFEDGYIEKSNGFKYEIILIDGGSFDKTWDLIEENIKEFPLVEIVGIRIRNNLGKGHCVKMGCFFSRGNFLLVIDADIPKGIKEYPRFKKVFDKGIKYTQIPLGNNFVHCSPDIIIGERSLDKRIWFRGFLSFFNNILVRFLFNLKLKDTQCGFKLFRRSAARRIFLSTRLMKWAFDVEVILLAEYFEIGVKTKEIVFWKEEEGSKVNLLKAIFLFFRDYTYLLYLFNFRMNFKKVEK